MPATSQRRRRTSSRSTGRRPATASRAGRSSAAVTRTEAGIARTLPSGVAGQLVDDVDLPGQLVGGERTPRRRSAQLRRASERAPSATTQAVTTSPHSSDGVPVTATSATRGMGEQHVFDLGG